MGLTQTHSLSTLYLKSSFECMNIVKKSNSDSTIETNEESTLSFSKTLYHTFQWKRNAGSVLLTGSFCEWKYNHFLNKDKNGIFSLTLEIPEGLNEFKFIVDGKDTINPCYPKKKNDKGIEVNYIHLKNEEEKEKEKEKIESSDYTSFIGDLNSKLGKPKPLNLFYKKYNESNVNKKNLLLDGFYTPNVILNHLFISKNYYYKKVTKSLCKIRCNQKNIKIVYYKPNYEKKDN